jgi:hypothetical protein
MRHLLTLSILFLVFACNTQPENKNEEGAMFSPQEIAAMHDDVMAIHDDVMPKMDDIYREKTRLTEQLEGLTDSAQIETLQTSILHLEEADEAMMQWMREFNPRQFESDTTALIQYYNDEKSRIEEVRNLMNTSLEAARAL